MRGIVRTTRLPAGRRAARAMLPALGAGALLALSAPLPAQAQTIPYVLAGDVREEIGERADSDVEAFYAARANRPLWLEASGRPSPAVAVLLHRLASAEFDAIDPRKLKLKRLNRLLERAGSGKARDIARAELALSETFARYVQAMRAVRHGGMIYESEALAPAIPSVGAALHAAAAAQGALARYVEDMGWMHPLYAPMRDALFDRALSEAQRARIWQNLGRIRALPGTPPERYALVDTADARLWLYEDGKRVDSMRVVVGKPSTQTPAMAGFLRYAIVNPYWNVPPDLVRDTIAPNVLDRGLGYLEAGGYEVLSDWSAAPEEIDPRTVDWRAVAAGAQSVRVRQLPGGGNFMGKAKFEFPNPQGIYLHDTPDKALLRKDGRQFSAGCVRLEDAAWFGRWLLGEPLPRARARDPEQRIALPQLVPIYITYLTAVPEKGGIAFRPDVYGRDGGGEARSERMALGNRP